MIIKKDLIKFTFGSYLTASLIIISFIVFRSANFLDFSSTMYHFGRFTGLTSIIFLGFIIFWGDTAKFFDRYFGLDRIIFFNKRFGLMTTLIALLHPMFFILSSYSFISYLIPDFTSLPLALGTVAFYLLIIFSISSFFYKKVSNTAWQYLHVVSYAIFFFGIYHGFKIGTDSSHILIKLLYLVDLTLVLIGIVYRTAYKLKKQGTYQVKVLQENNLNQNIFSVKIEKPKRFKFIPGQFAFISMQGFHARHPFTISSSPNEDHLEFTIKIAGKFTQALQKVNVNALLKLEGPFGVFTVKPEQKNLVFMAGGIGITPFKSLSNNLLHDSQATLFYCVRKQEDFVFKKTFDQNDRLNKVYLTSREDRDGYCHGRINKDLLNNNVEEVRSSYYFICGPELFKKHIMHILSDLNVPQKNIFYEEFLW